MKKGNKLLLGALFAVAFYLIGFVPPYLDLREARLGVANARADAGLLRERLAAEEYSVELGELRDQVSLMYLETSRKNYGVADNHSTAFSDALQEVTSSSKPQTAGLQDLSARRDQITALLAKGDEASLAAVRELMLATFRITRQ